MSTVNLNIEKTEDSKRCGMGDRLIGFDLTADHSEETISALRKAMLDSPALVIPGQKLEAQQLKAFGERFGALQIHPAERYRHPDFPQLSYVSNVGPDGKVDEYGQNQRATGWHADGSYRMHPYSFAILYCLEAPNVGGKTLFANLCLAYDNMPEDLRAAIENKTAIHAIGSGPDGAASPSAQKRQLFPEQFPDIEKPVVMVHPETGRKAAYINPMHTSHIVGDKDRDAQDSLYQAINAHNTKDDFVYGHRWTPGDVVIWDQRATLHRGGGGFPPTERRVMLRTIIKGLDDTTEAAA